MPTVIPVKFKYAARDLWFDPRDTGAVEADHVICRTGRGLEIGIVTSDAREVSRQGLKAVCGEASLKPVERIATEADLERAEELAERGEAALPTFRRLAEASGLDMKPVGVEWIFGGEKVVCYFSAEERVDFRQLVRDLSRELHERIDMRQIGVREEAAVMGGYAHCGQELCCARFGRQFEPVSIRMAKEQDLPLNSAKISGACGRLMCCLRYEFEAYRDFKSRAPKRNAVIDTPLGKAKIVEYDTPKEQLALRLENGKQVRVALSDMEASDAAKRKAEELGCACRPDTVTRAALERLQSPDVQMALAELDREMGVVPTEAPTSDDIFVGSRSRRRRRGTAPDAATSPAKEVTTSRTRRRRKKRPAAEGAGVETPLRDTSQAREAQPKDARGEQEPRSRRRRRHHASAKAGGEARAAAVTQADGSASDAKRPRRRPGDKGGTQAPSGGQDRATAPSRPDDAQQASASTEGAPRKRRRRHRGGRGRGKGNGNGAAGAAGGGTTSE